MSNMTPAATHYAIRTPTGGDLCYPIRPGFPIPDGAGLLVPMSVAADLIARNAELESERDALLAAVKLAKPYIATHVTACHGEKCREMNCESCFSDAHENAEKGRKALEAITRAEAGHA